MNKLQFHTQKSGFMLQLIGTVLVSIMLVVGIIFLGIIFFGGSLYTGLIQNIYTAFDSSIGIGIFTVCMYGTIFLLGMSFLTFIGYSLYKGLEQAYFRRENTLIIELTPSEYIFYTFEGTKKIIFEHIQDIALSVVPVTRNGRNMERRVYFHIKTGYESFYPDALDWEITETSIQTKCLEVPLFKVETHDIAQGTKNYTDMELYLKIKEFSKLPETALPE